MDFKCGGFGWSPSEKYFLCTHKFIYLKQLCVIVIISDIMCNPNPQIEIFFGVTCIVNIVNPPRQSGPEIPSK
jgi:hypothetical protein